MTTLDRPQFVAQLLEHEHEWIGGTLTEFDQHSNAVNVTTILGIDVADDGLFRIRGARFSCECEPRYLNVADPNLTGDERMFSTPFGVHFWIRKTASPYRWLPPCAATLAVALLAAAAYQSQVRWWWIIDIIWTM